MKIETIQKHLQGYFINTITHNDLKVSETLCKKIDNKNYEIVPNVKTNYGTISAYSHLLNQCNNQLLDPTISIVSLSEILPTINGNLFEDYRIRQKKINKYKKWIECVRTENNKYVNNTHLIKWKKARYVIYGVVGKDTIEEINDILLSEKEKDSAIAVKYPKLLKSAVKDNLINQFESSYLQEVKKYEKI